MAERVSADAPLLDAVRYGLEIEDRLAQIDTSELEHRLRVGRYEMKFKLVANPGAVEQRDDSVRFNGVTLHLTSQEHKTLLAFAALKDAFVMDALRDAGIREEIVRGLQADPRNPDEKLVSARVSLFKRGRQLTDRYVWSPDIVGFLYHDGTTVEGIPTPSPSEAGQSSEASTMKSKKVKTAKKKAAPATARAWNRTYALTGKAPDPAPGEGSNMALVLAAVSKTPQTVDEIAAKAKISTKQDKRAQVLIFLQKLSHRGAVKIEKDAAEDAPAKKADAPKKKVVLKKKR